jgi:hypothetical protein
MAQQMEALAHAHVAQQTAQEQNQLDVLQETLRNATLLSAADVENAVSQHVARANLLSNHIFCHRLKQQNVLEGKLAQRRRNNTAAAAQEMDRELGSLAPDDHAGVAATHRRFAAEANHRRFADKKEREHALKELGTALAAETNAALAKEEEAMSALLASMQVVD